MRNIAVVPILNGDVVQTTMFGSHKYIGEPTNIVKQLSDMGADEIFVIDITQRYRLKLQRPDLQLLVKIANQAYCPLGYGGGLYLNEDIELAKQIIKLGYEKIIAASAWWRNTKFYTQLSDKIGKQSVVKCLEFDEEDQPYDDEWGDEITKSATECGELFLVDTTRNGCLSGLNPKLCKLAKKSPIPTSVYGGYNGEKYDVDTAASTYYMLYKGQVMLNYENYHNTTL